MRKFLFNLVIIAILAGCSGGGGSGDGTQKPNDGLNSKISESGSHALIGQTALFETGLGMGSKAKINHQIITKTFDDHIGLSSIARPDAKAEVKAKAQLLSQSIQPNACKIVIEQQPPTGTTEGVAASFPTFKLKISGASCPVEILMDMSLAGIGGANPCKESQGSSTCRFTAKVKINQRILNDKLAAQMGVRSGHTIMIMEMEQSFSPGQGGSMDMALKGKSSFDFKAVDIEGKAHLISGTSEANLKMAMVAPGPNQTSSPQMLGGMSESLQYLNEFSGITSALTASVTFNGSSPDEKYYVDGNAVSAKAYHAERNKFANSMMEFGVQTEQGNQPPQDTQPIVVPLPEPQPQPEP